MYMDAEACRATSAMSSRVSHHGLGRLMRVKLWNRGDEFELRDHHRRAGQQQRCLARRWAAGATSYSRFNEARDQGAFLRFNPAHDPPYAPTNSHHISKKPPVHQWCPCQLAPLVMLGHLGSICQFDCRELLQGTELSQ